jgi:hypothetical protein
LVPQVKPLIEFAARKIAARSGKKGEHKKNCEKEKVKSYLDYKFIKVKFVVVRLFFCQSQVNFHRHSAGREEKQLRIPEKRSSYFVCVTV